VGVWFWPEGRDFLGAGVGTGVGWKGVGPGAEGRGLFLNLPPADFGWGRGAGGPCVSAKTKTYFRRSMY
jgi:hypothetical protein